MGGIVGRKTSGSTGVDPLRPGNRGRTGDSVVSNRVEQGTSYWLHDIIDDAANVGFQLT